MKLKFVKRNNHDAELLLQPAAVEALDAEFVKLEEQKGRIFAELSYFLFTSRIFYAAMPDSMLKLGNVAASLNGRLATEVFLHIYGAKFGDKLDEAMEDVSGITERVLPKLVAMARDEQKENL